MQEAVLYKTRMAQTEADIQRAQALRAGLFYENVDEIVLDNDEFDHINHHVLIESVETGELLATFRFMHLPNGNEIEKCYSAQYYDLSRLKKYCEAMIEVGRFCLREDIRDPGLLRTAWTFLTTYVDENDISLMFGCSSFRGTDEDKYTDTFALLKERHLAPDVWRPCAKAGEVFRFADHLKDHKPVLKLASQNMPPLLRTYLTMGGWVSDHAVIDRALGTLHVFTGVEIGRIPQKRAQLLRNDADVVRA
ncbi:GNAT family N-acetyltransferase [Amylibacter sp. SFDW26]|uniref:GNAT family N-acetyltransferase n=1 Tax=Amylibacter sp. SFDW26 TaxID=2652722 RepID=UPI0012626D82|nr:GNAT family N-acyltransferase [Amylibacter sp. SFDW26]KAB7616305.1 GNAT family N-acetyltransferase [Amylibacter sp. SFDW26]